MNLFFQIALTVAIALPSLVSSAAEAAFGSKIMRLVQCLPQYDTCISKMERPSAKLAASWLPLRREAPVSEELVRTVGYPEGVWKPRASNGPVFSPARFR